MNYQKIYNQIIERAKVRKLEGYKERHHIIPKCLGGDNNKENIIKLTAKEHFLCHRLLCEIYPNNLKLKQALWCMTIGFRKSRNCNLVISSKIYERLRQEFSTSIKGHKYNLGKKQSKETIAKRVAKIKGQKLSKEVRKIISDSKIGNRHAIKTVLQYSLQNNFIKEWNCIKDAATSVTNINKAGANIVAVCKGRKLTAYGYIWKYKHD